MVTKRHDLAEAGNLFDKRALLAGILAAAPNFVIAFTFLVTWRSPYYYGTYTVRSLLLVMLFEFISVHAALLIGGLLLAFADLSRRLRLLILLGLCVFYSFFAGMFSLMFATWWPFLALWGLVLRKFWFVLTGQSPSGHERQMMLVGWSLSVALYVLFAVATVLLPVPAFGITDAVRESQELSISGLWIEEPQRAIAFGFLYFSALGVAELFSYRWPSWFPVLKQ